MVAPVARCKRPITWHFGPLGVVAGVPVGLDRWIGGLASSLALGALSQSAWGAILQIIRDLTKLVSRDEGHTARVPNLLAYDSGLLIIYVIDVFISLNPHADVTTMEDPRQRVERSCGALERRSACDRRASQ